MTPRLKVMVGFSTFWSVAQREGMSVLLPSRAFSAVKLVPLSTLVAEAVTPSSSARLVPSSTITGSVLSGTWP